MILVSCLYNKRHKPKCVALLFFYWYFPRCSLLSTTVGASKGEKKLKICVYCLITSRLLQKFCVISDEYAPPV